ncbi:odorant receptor 4-like [Vespula squamosa]|uniref:Odorant receptor 4-like n=1 Tax=Vespula squamosa TaxID=30214 RepID=A0ABD2ADK2_VESSQ
MIKFDWGELKNPEEIAIIEKYATKSKNYTIILTVIFIGFFFIFVTIYLLPHLLNVVVPLNQPRKSKSFPIEAFFDIEGSIYGLVLVFLAIASLGVIALAAYGSFLLFIQHACGMLSLTGFTLEHIFVDSEQCIYNINENEMIYKSIIRSIRFHIRTLKFIDFIKDVSEECYTIQILLALFLIATDYMKIKKEIFENTDDAIICIIHIIGIMFSLFINCHAGQQIIDHSNYVFHKTSERSSQRMDFFFENGHYDFIQISLSPVGLWPSTEPKTRLIRRFIVIFNCFSILSLQTLKIIMTNYKVDIIFEILPYFLVCFAGIFMHLNNSINSSQMYRLLEIIKDDWCEQEGTKEFEVMKKYAQDSRTYSIIMLAIFYIPIYVIMIASTLPLALDFINPLNETRPRTLPFLMEFYVDERKHFCLLLMIIFVMLLILGLTVISNCTLFLVFIQHLCGMFYVVGNMVDNVFNDKHCSELETYAKIVRCIKYHKQALEFNTPWYLLTKKSQILLWFMMARSTKPCYLSFGKPFCISIQFFASIISIITADDFQLLMEVISNFVLYLTCVLMYYNSLFNMPKISQLLELIKQDWLEKENMKEFEIMKKYAEDGRMYSLMILMLTYGLIVSVMSVSAVPYILDIYFPLNQTRFRTLPFSVELFIDIEKHYCLAWFITFFISSLSCVAIVGNYTLFAVLVFHICGMFCVVRNMLNDVVDVTKEYIRDCNTEDKAYAKIIRSIKYHKKALEFDSIFNSSFEQGLSILLVLGSIIIIITFLRIKELLIRINRDWCERGDTKEFKIMKQYAEESRIYMIIMIIINYASLFSNAFIPATPFILDIFYPLNETRPRLFPFPVKFLIDTEKYYYFLLIISYASVSLLLIAGISHYAFCLSFVQHICGMYMVVGNMLEDLFDDKTFDNFKSEDKSYPKIVQSIKYHKEALKYRELPYPVVDFIDQQKYFYHLSVLSFMVVLEMSFCGIANYALIAVFIQYMCGMFSVVGNMLENALDSKLIKSDNPNKEAEIYAKIVCSIKYHKEALKFDADFNALFETTYLIMLICAPILITLGFVRILQDDAFETKNQMETIHSLINVLCNLFFVYGNCYLGQKVIDQSVFVFDKA